MTSLAGPRAVTRWRADAAKRVGALLPARPKSVGANRGNGPYVAVKAAVFVGATANNRMRSRE
jgi:hypothetical protein